MFRSKIKPVFAFTAVALLGLAVDSNALPTVGSTPKKQLLKTAAGCDPATATIELDINNVRARIMTGGDMWWNQGTSNAAYEVPKGTKKNALFAGSVWVGGFTADKQLKVCAQTYRSNGNDYWPGPLYRESGAWTIDKATCSEWDRFWKINKETLNKFRELVRTGGNTQLPEFQSIWEWPAKGNGISGIQNNNTYSRAKGTSGLPLNMEDDHEYAPFVNNPVPGNDPNIYEPELGDFPGDPLNEDLLGDQYIWWVFNDRGNTKGQTKTESVGMEIQTGAFAFSSKDFMNDATFYNYKLINHGTSDLDSTYMATWTDADLGYAFDDYIGCDTVRGLGILYNGDGIDGAGEANSYGTDIPMVGVDFFIGPTKEYIDSTGQLTDSLLKMTAFTYFNNGSDVRIGDPTNGAQHYNYMSGTSRNGEQFNNDFQGPGIHTNALGAGPKTNFVFFGDPDKNEWSECNSGNDPWDRRFIHSAGPFVLRPGKVNNITIGVVWVPNTGGCPNTSFAKIRLADDQAQALFDNNFKRIEGPEAPNLVKREMDRKIIFYLTNPSSSTNFLEKYGYETDTAKYRVASLKAKNNHNPDSLYKFEGYRVFQLKSDNITPSQIFNERGEVNNEVAVEVFQTDIKNGIKEVVNWDKNVNITGCDTCFTPVLKVSGRDSGIVHSFEITQDRFAQGSDKRLVNYRNYYFVAIAYATNNFAGFDPKKPEATQDVAYLESSHGAGGSEIKVIDAMPNPFSHTVGTEINSGYGDGVVIKKMEGIGNGGNFLQISRESEDEALLAVNNYQSLQPVYETNQGPVNIKVVDPLKVEPGNWSIYIRPDYSQAGPYENSPTPGEKATRLVASKTQWFLVKDNQDTIFSERDLSALNEQIVTQYGLSISIKQEVRPGDNQEELNGKIGSSIEFSDPKIAWLAGVNDGEQTSQQNWIRSGGYTYVPRPGESARDCNINDYTLDTTQNYENLLSNYSFTIGTWAPYSLAAAEQVPNEVKAGCYFYVAKVATKDSNLNKLPSIDVVFTSDTSKWTRSIVLETNQDGLGTNNTPKFELRSHRSWNKEMDASGNPIYSSDPSDVGVSYFPGYAINQETGERLNIVFGEDSYMKNDNGDDMLWNPTGRLNDDFGNPIWGGRHFVYISNTKYDRGEELLRLLKGPNFTKNNAFRTFQWMGVPLINRGFNLKPLREGLIPTETRLKFRVTKPYGRYIPEGMDTTAAGSNGGYPWYTFNTSALAKKNITDTENKYANDKQALLDRMFVVPNPYYAHAEYEANRLDTRVRIIGLPQRATIYVYSLDGSLIRKLDKDNNVSYMDWDTRNAKGLPIASGMYLIHINAEGIGEKVIRWFGAMRPIDITQY